MRSLTRVSVLMGPPLLGFCLLQSRPVPKPVRIQRWKHHTISKKALQKQGPMPTDHGLKLVKPPALLADKAYTMPLTGPHSLDSRSWLAVGVGLHLTVPGLRRDGRSR